MTSSALQSQYDDAATWWQRTIYRLGYRHAYEDLMPRALSGISVRSVADIGCGTGDLAAAFCIRCGAPDQLTLMDGSATMLTAAQDGLKHIAPQIETRHAMLGVVTDKSEHDLVLCAHLIEHIPDSTKALGDLAALTKPGGHILLIVSKPHWCNWVIWLRWRHKWFSETAMRGMASTAGLSVVECFQLRSGPPSRTSLAYLMQRPKA